MLTKKFLLQDDWDRTSCKRHYCGYISNMVSGLKTLLCVFSMTESMALSALPTREELEEIKKPELPKDFFSSLTYTASDIILVESGSFYIEQCARLGELRKIIINPIFKWYGPNVRKEVNGHRFIQLSNGDLAFMRPTPKETGTYFCRMSSSDIEDYFEEYQRSVVVFTPPTWVKEVFLYVLVVDCSKETRDKLLNSTENYLCKTDSYCLYHVKIDKCSSDQRFLEMMEARVRIHVHLNKFFVTTLPPNCGIECVLNHSSLELDRFSKNAIFDLRSSLKMVDREKTGLILQDTKTTFTMKPLCIEGYEIYNEKVCIPCNIGRARRFDVDNQKCQLCGLLSYSSIIGSVECMYCPLFRISYHYGANSLNDCIWFYQSTHILLLIVPMFVLVSLIIGFFISLIFEDNRHRLRGLIYDCCCPEDDKEIMKVDER